jgi:membrane-bound lytic murein transglycosylase MltF
MARIYPKDLEGRAAPLDPHWAIRAMVLYMRQLRKASLGFGEEAHTVALVKYNGGSGWVAREARAAEAAGDDPTRWFGHVENYCLRAKWACTENRDYPRKILFRWWPMFQKAGW